MKRKGLIELQPYTRGFADVYEVLMDHICYEDWAEYISDILEKEGITSGLILDLGCGTGKMTRLMAARGYEMIGIDISQEMLSVAREYGEEEQKEILYLCQDMRDFELYGTVAAIICVCAGMNQMLNEEDLRSVFRLANNYLDPGGVFIFDMDTPYAYEEVMGDTTFAVNREEGSFIWENNYYPEEAINEVDLTLFIPHENGLYEKWKETHLRRGYSLETIRRLMEEAGMEWVAAYDELSTENPNQDSERVYIVAREKYHGDKLYIEDTPSE